MSASPHDDAPTRPRDLRIWVVEDNDLYREAVAAVLDGSGGFRCPVAVSSCEEALERLDRPDADEPDVVLMDIGLPGMDGIEGARRLGGRVPEARVIMLTVHEEDDKVYRAICAGASGYLLKPTEPRRVVEAVSQVAAGGAPINPYIARKLLHQFTSEAPARPDYGLTDREAEILELLVEGLTMKGIARRLGVSYHTVDSHIRHIYGKLHVRSRSRAVAKALTEGLVGR